VTTGKKDHPSDEAADAPGMAATALSAAAKRATQALDSAKGAVAGADLDELGSKAVAAASTLYHQGRDLISNSEELTQAKDELSGAIRKNPLAAVGIAFTAGLLIALLARG
jgi:ElaB/YqjD/DUF883 family membrane-anchored ribosome-binding protein